MVGAIQLSVNLEKLDGSIQEHMIARISNFPYDLREKMTEVVNGKPQLKKEFYGQVVEIDGQDISARSKRFTHARIVRWRPDRSSNTCIMTEDFLESLIL